MTVKTVQYFTDEYLEQCKKLSSEEILQFLEDYRVLHANKLDVDGPTKLISIKINEHLLRAFRQKAELHGHKYQTLIKELMQEWLLKAP